MAERIRVVVQAPDAHPLAIEDAMEQVLCFFQLLYERAQADDLIWAITAASLASPLVIEAEARSKRKGVDISLQARKQKETLDKRLRSVRRGEMPAEWRGTKRASIATELLKRNANGIGRTEVVFEGDEQPVVFDKQVAQQSLAALTGPIVHQFKAHQEIGSIEGSVISVGSYYDQNAIRVRDRRNGEEVVCIVPPDAHDLIVRNVGLDDVWENLRVTVHGVLTYDDHGTVRKVVADRLEALPSGSTPMEALYDPEFTEGLDVTTYVERLREGA